MKTLLLFIAGIFVTAGASSGNLSLAVHSLEETSALQISVSWDDSWFYTDREPYNHDAVWVFIKTRPVGGEWQHLHVSSDSTEHTADGSVRIIPVDDEAGVFIRRHAPGTGITEANEIYITFSEALPHADYDFRVFGIEMIWVPEGSFYLGDGKSINSFTESGTEQPFLVDTDEEIPVNNGSGSLSSLDEAAPENNITTLFPSGYSGFYIMKHALTQEQYVDFLNTLTYAQQNSRTVSIPSDQEGSPALAPQLHGSRNNIAIKQPGEPGGRPAIYGLVDKNTGAFGTATDGRHRACNFLNWADLTAYLSWAGLRPLTEMEYEKASRGPKFPVGGEFAWGTPEVTNAKTLLQDGTGKESVEETATGESGLALHGYDGVPGPLRAGFAGPGTTGRLQTGTSYYGIFDLSGNLWEQVVMTSQKGLGFSAIPGNGMLTKTGNAGIEGWPGADAKGAGYRGGGWNSGIFSPGNFRDLAVSDRFYGFQPPVNRTNTSGGRGGR